MEYTYFAQEQGGERLIKIGRTSYLYRRIPTLARERGCPVMLLGVVPFREYGERALHNQFSFHRREGEWFCPHSDILEFIAIHAQPYTFPARRVRMLKPIDPNKATFKTKLPELMEKRGITLEILSADTGISVNALRRWIRGRLYRVEVRPLGILCMYFNCTPGELLGITPAIRS